MNALYGPWTTAMHAGAAAQLSAFWKSRMAMLSRVAQVRSALSYRAALVLLLAGATVCAIPTWYGSPSAAKAKDGNRDGPTLPQVLKGLKDNERAILAYQVKCELSSRLAKTNHRTNQIDGEFSRTISARYCGDAKSRVRREASSKTVFDGMTDTLEVTAVFDGKVGRRLETLPNGFHVGRITKDTALIFEGEDPLDFIVRVQGEPAYQFLEKNKARIVGSEMWDGRKVVVLETEIVKAKTGHQFMTRVLVDSERFVIAKRTECIRYGDDETWLDYEWYEMHGHVRDALGIWVPSRVVTVSHFFPQKRLEKLPLFRRAEMRLTDWAINPDLPETTFTLDWPDGTLVNDEIKDRTFSAPDDE